MVADDNMQQVFVRDRVQGRAVPPYNATLVGTKEKAATYAGGA